MFRERLQKIVDGVEGGVVGLLMGFDGLPVETYQSPSARVDLQGVALEFSLILGEIRQAAQTLEVGAVREVTIHAEKLTVLMRVLDQGYFLALAIEPDGNFGKGRYLLRMAAPKMTAEL
jgi:predicted regulator of Ras-like GTPase activity (Roadblock/LC7/MglB family)